MCYCLAQRHREILVQLSPTSVFESVLNQMSQIEVGGLKMEVKVPEHSFTVLPDLLSSLIQIAELIRK